MAAVFYAAVDKVTREVNHVRKVEPDASAPAADRLDYYLVEGPLDYTGMTATRRMKWVDGAAQLVETGHISTLRAAKIEAMNEACSAQIVLGFDSSALGSPYRYPSNLQAQTNLMGSVTDSLMAGNDPDWRTPFWCCDEVGTWEYRQHTIAQIQQVGRDGKASILASLAKNEALRRQIDAATADELNDIQW